MCKRQCVMVVPCMLAAGLQAEANAGTPAWGVPFINLMTDNHVDILLLPCCESTFQGPATGSFRRKHGIDYYSGLLGYPEYCERQAIETAEGIESLLSKYRIMAILGVEHSPTCAVKYMYSRSGMRKEPGIFMRKLMENLSRMNLEIPFLGINRKYPRKALLAMKTIIQASKES